ncbi:hypothetical protein NC653_001221 [Populus alba x Populus x berolinensis]|uniref:Transcription factor CBF/NF-Y/archaeal histone domain-containing protein n=1 Tax=Populus alba x Populus x berolinensis TaxID=444605 RepID=A0AAD6RKJ1_9ROSI|nr:hypothetical protein NC653_001221 [Populus alba x Populus x berolinensis]
MKKSSDDVKMISGEAPIVFSKACDLFIEDLTQRSWIDDDHARQEEDASQGVIVD